MEEAFYNQKNGEIRKVSIEQAAGDYPEDVRNLAVLMYRSEVHGSYDAALSFCGQILSARPGLLEARLEWGQLLTAMGKMQEALDLYQQILLDNPGSIDAQIGLGHIWYAAGDLEKARDLFDRAGTSISSNIFFYLDYADSLEAMAEAPEKIRALYEKNVEFYEREKDPVIPERMNRSFQGLLLSDIHAGDLGSYVRDEKRYFAFLDGMVMDPDMQKALSESIEALSKEISQKWYLPLFREFLGRVEAGGYLKRPEYALTLSNARRLCDTAEGTGTLASGTTYQRMQPKIMPNDPCPCGSGKKYKNCHGRRR